MAFRVCNIQEIHLGRQVDDPENGKKGSLLKFSHSKDENVIFLNYFSEPLNNKNLPAEIFGAIIMVPYGPFDLLKIQINPKSFMRFGAVDGKTKW